jgi:hypothetical protein
MRVKFFGTKWPASSFTIAMDFGEHRHQTAGDTPVVFATGFCHSHQLPKR